MTGASSTAQSGSVCKRIAIAIQCPVTRRLTEMDGFNVGCITGIRDGARGKLQPLHGLVQQQTIRL